MKSTFLSFNRIGRTGFLAFTNITYSLLALAYYFAFSSIDIDGHSSISLAFEHNPVIFILLLLVSLLPLKFLAQRYKDAGLTGWWALVGLLPTSYFILYFLMGIFRGEPYKNEYGIIPSESGIFLRIFAYVPALILSIYIIYYLVLL